jgi:hypothetical protein
MFSFRAARLAILVAFALTSTSCSLSGWPWANSSGQKPKRESKTEKCARLVREACDAALAMRRSDMLELEGAAIVGTLGGVTNASRLVASRASDAGRSASVSYVDALLKLSKLPDGMVDAQLDSFTYQNREKIELLVSVKPVIRGHLQRTRLGLKPIPEDCFQDLQSVRYDM